MTPAQGATAIKIVGYCVMPNVIGDDLVAGARTRLSELLAEDERRFGRDYLIQVGEWGRTRLVANRGHVFIELLELAPVHALLEHILNDYRVLYYNGTSLFPQQTRTLNPGGKWHADLRLCTGTPEWLNVLYLLEDFTLDNGATFVIPGSQQRPFPTKIDPDLHAVLEAHKIQVVAPAGSVVVFDSTLWHSAGDNMTDKPRLMIAGVVGKAPQTVNYRPQFDHARALDAGVVAELSPLVRRILGLDDHPIPGSIEEYFVHPESEGYLKKRGEGGS